MQTPESFSLPDRSPFQTKSSSNNKMATLTAMNDDIIHCILECLITADPFWIEVEDKRAIMAFSSTCSTYRQLAAPYLFRSISWQWGRTAIERARATSKVSNVLLKVISDTGFANYVRYVEFSGRHGVKSVDEMVLNSDQFERETAVLKKEVLTAQVPGVESWMEAIEKGDIGVRVALLIGKLRLLKSLKIDFHVLASGMGFVGKMFAHLTMKSLSPDSTFSSFASLTSVRYKSRWLPVMHEVNAGEMVMPLYCPALRTLDVFRVVASNQPLRWTHRDPPRMSIITTLHLDYVQIGEQALTQVLCALPNLETFHYTALVMQSPPQSVMQWSARELFQPLLSARSSLKHLDLNAFA